MILRFISQMKVNQITFSFESQIIFLQLKYFPKRKRSHSSCNKEGDNKCLEGYFCNENTCSKCHELCSECYASHLSSCTQCKIIDDDDDEHITNTECKRHT